VPVLFNICRKLFHLLILSQKNCSLFWHSPVSDLSMATSLCHFRTFCSNRRWNSLSAAFILMPFRSYCRTGWVFSAYFRSLCSLSDFPTGADSMYLPWSLRIIKLLHLCMNHFRHSLLTVFSFLLSWLRGFIPCPATFRFAWLYVQCFTTLAS